MSRASIVAILVLAAVSTASPARAEWWDDYPVEPDKYAFVVCRWEAAGELHYGVAGAGTLDRPIQEDPEQMRWSLKMCRQWMREDGGSNLEWWAHSPWEPMTVEWQPAGGTPAR
jgi:hypothetical protein